MLKEYKVFGDLHNPEFEDTEKIYKQIETVLTELKRLQEENKKMEIEIANHVYWESTRVDEIKKMYIPM